MFPPIWMSGLPASRERNDWAFAQVHEKNYVRCSREAKTGKQDQMVWSSWSKALDHKR